MVEISRNDFLLPILINAGAGKAIEGLWRGRPDPRPGRFFCETGISVERLQQQKASGEKTLGTRESGGNS